MPASDNTTPAKASRYDSHILRTIPYYRDIHEQVLDLVFHLNPNPTTWLDTGCGTGAMVKLARSRFPETRFFLADPSPTMLANAQKGLSKDGENVVFLDMCESEELPGPDLPPLDVVSAVQVHHYLDEAGRTRATKACYDCLDSEGVFVTVENFRPDTAAGIEVALKRWADFQLSAGKKKERVEKHTERFDVKYHPITVSKHLELLRSIGFKTAEMFWLSYMQAGFYALK